MTFNFDAHEDFIDSRDIIARIAELEAEWEENTGAIIADYAVLGVDDLAAGLAEDDAFELHTLHQFVEAYSADIADWEYGETLIHEDYFTEYVKDFLRDTGYIASDFPEWIEIDWDATADNVKCDYQEVILNGQTYYAR